MSGKPVVPRQQARTDAQAAIDHYAANAGDAVAFGFIDALETAYRSISARPATGSPLYGHELDLPGLRHKRLKRFPYLVVYVERADHIDVWRILDGHRDIPTGLGERQG